MLFNSYAFVFGFLPACLAGYYLVRHACGRDVALGFLTTASFVFYIWTGLFDSVLLGVSIVVNFSIALLLADLRNPAHRRTFLVAGVVLNLACLGYFKYFNFLRSIFEGGPAAASYLPLGISFYTFVQITYVVDVFRGAPIERNPIRYALFVTFFPHLIAGPILHHTDLLPQFRSRLERKQAELFFAAGLSIFVIGLFKKVVLADPLAAYADAAFNAVRDGTSVTFAQAWIGLIAYTFQLYFDFSGYSDMAVGLAAMFGIRLPINFFSPYKAASIGEFWRRWHMTLSRFLRDYVYIPLGGNRRGSLRRYLNVVVTMLIGGLWHGPGWTFLLWGGVHGLMVVVHGLAEPVLSRLRIPRAAGIAITFLCVVLAWVLFRASSLEAAGLMYRGLFGLEGLGIDASISRRAVAHIAAIALIVFCLPNTSEFMGRFDPGVIEFARVKRKPAALTWAPTWYYGAAIAVAFVWCLALMWELESNPPFIYFNF
jgi:alginate O-acetyltransferase complex protein AlgI